MKKLLIFASAMLLSVRVFATEFPDITIAELKTAIESKQVVLLDANGTESYQAGHIPGAINFATDKTKLASELPADKTKLVVAYCGNPACHAYLSAAEEAKKLGYKNIKHLKAGIAGWKDAGEKTEKGS